MLILLLLTTGILLVIWSACATAHTADEEADRLLMHLQNGTEMQRVEPLADTQTKRPITLSPSVT